MPRKLHMMTGAIYETLSEGIARVTTPDGRTGNFDDTGCWLEGELREADPLLCLWVAGRQLPAGMAANTKDLPLETAVNRKGSSS